ncbi:MAG: hypothetical protein V2B20_08430 [Pseudomonadota bacterium]
MLIKNLRVIIVLIVLLPFITEGIAAQALPESTQQVWQVGTGRWDSTEEQRFAEWVEKTINEDFFIRYGIAVDCADVPYAARWIYSRIAHLPAAFTTEDGTLLGHWSTAWKNLPQAKEWYRDRRFRQSLLLVLSETSTRTLPLDTYPIRITAQSLSAGAMFIGEGHAGLVGHIVLDGSTYSPVQTWEATLPRKVQQVHQKSYFASSVDINAVNGLVRFRWPIFAAERWQYLPAQDHPFYSLEQYSRNFCSADEVFDQAVARRIDPKQYEPAMRARLIIDSIYRYLLIRVHIVQEGFNRCRKNKCPEGSYLWEVYSTPGRDDMIDFEIFHLQKLIKDNKLDEEALAKKMEERVISIATGQTVTLKHVVQNHSWLSHDPDDSITARWALAKCDMIRSRIQNSLVAMDFVEQRYRRTDPKYANSRRDHNIHELEWLHDQGKVASCNDL